MRPPPCWSQTGSPRRRSTPWPSGAGIAKGTVYLYSASRSDLLAALRSRYAQGLADRAGSILEHADPADPGSVTGTLDRLAAELLHYVHASQRLYHV